MLQLGEIQGRKLAELHPQIQGDVNRQFDMRVSYGGRNIQDVFTLYPDLLDMMSDQATPLSAIAWCMIRPEQFYADPIKMLHKRASDTYAQ